MTVARHGEQFSHAERDVFLYLVGQVSSSIENIALHELVSEQAVTDELTGLSNNRRFRELISKEAARAQRFGHELSLIMLDLDDFKRVNDTYGHLQGDEVLRTIGAVLQSESRGVDEPARYGGEEFVVALPETGLDGRAGARGAHPRPDRVASAIPRIDGAGTLRITASVGRCLDPGVGADGADLIAAADAALYEAKRAGKNRVSGAPEQGPRTFLSAQGRPSTANSDHERSPRGEFGCRRPCRKTCLRAQDGAVLFSPSIADGNPRRRDSPAPRPEAAARRRPSPSSSSLEDEAFGPPSRPGEPDFPEARTSPRSSQATAPRAKVPSPSPRRAEAPIAPPSKASTPRPSRPRGRGHRRGATAGEAHEPTAAEPTEPPAAEPTPEAEEQTAIYDHTGDGRAGARGAELGADRGGDRAAGRAADRVAGHRRALAARRRTSSRRRRRRRSPPRAAEELEAARIEEHEEPESEEERDRQPRDEPEDEEDETSSRTRRSSSRTLPRTTSSGSSRASPKDFDF